MIAVALIAVLPGLGSGPSPHLVRLGLSLLCDRRPVSRNADTTERSERSSNGIARRGPGSCQTLNQSPTSAILKRRNHTMANTDSHTRNGMSSRAIVLRGRSFSDRKSRR